MNLDVVQIGRIVSVNLELTSRSRLLGLEFELDSKRKIYPRVKVLRKKVTGRRKMCIS